MAWAEGLQNLAIVLAALVGIANQQTDRSAGSTAFIHTRENLDLIGFLPLRDMAAGAGAAPIQIRLDVGHGQLHARWTAVDHAANGRAVGFTKAGDCKQGA